MGQGLEGREKASGQLKGGGTQAWGGAVLPVPSENNLGLEQGAQGAQGEESRKRKGSGFGREGEASWN